jgi:hypothetical protein
MLLHGVCILIHMRVEELLEHLYYFKISFEGLSI